MSEFDYMEVFVDGVPQRRRCALAILPGPKFGTDPVRPQWRPELFDGEEVAEEVGGRIHIHRVVPAPLTHELTVEFGSFIDTQLKALAHKRESFTGPQLGLVQQVGFGRYEVKSVDIGFDRVVYTLTKLA